MNVTSKLKKEGLENISKLQPIKINTIAKNVSDLLGTAFSEHNLSSSILFNELADLNMYTAKMPENSAGAKYFYKNNSIYFNENLDFTKNYEFSVHECIHYIQQKKDKVGKLLRLGLTDFSDKTNAGNSINEAAVQLLTCTALEKAEDIVKYYGINLPTISENSYPIQCVLLNQMAFFTGNYSLTHSTIHSDDMFKDNFSFASNKKTYYSIAKNMDSILKIESELSVLVSDLSNIDTNNNNLKNKISMKKHEILNLFFKTQNLIITECFTKEFETIETYIEIDNYKLRLNNFKNRIGTNLQYTFYDDFCSQQCFNLIEKQKQIDSFVNGTQSFSTALTISDKTSFISILKKLLKLFNRGQEERFY